MKRQKDRPPVGVSRGRWRNHYTWKDGRGDALRLQCANVLTQLARGKIPRKQALAALPANLRGIVADLSPAELAAFAHQMANP